MRKALVWLLAVMLAGAAHGQTRATQWRAYQTADGLPTNLCVSVSLGNHGKIWVSHGPGGAISGLDGYMVNLQVAPTGFVGRVGETPNGQLWVVTREGLQEYRNDKWTTYPVPQIADALEKAAPAGDNSIPILPVRTGHVLCLLPEKLLEFSAAETEADRVRTVREATQSRLGRFLGMAVSPRDGAVWLSGQHGLARATRPVRELATPPYENTNGDWLEFIPPPELFLENLREPVPDADGGVTVVGNSAKSHQAVLAHFDGAEQWEARVVGHENLRRAWRGPDKLYWVMTRDALYRLENGNEPGLTEEELARQYYDVAVEPGGLFWLATSEGLFRYSPPTWTTPSPERELAAPVLALTRDNANRMWLLLPDSLVMYASNQIARHPLPGLAGTGAGTGQMLYAMADGSIVVAGRDGLLRFDRGSNQFQAVQIGDHERVRALGMLGEGTLCVMRLGARPAGEAAQLSVYDGREFRTPPFPAPPASLGGELLLTVSPDGTVWLAGSRAVARYQGQRWQAFGPALDRPPERISSFTEVSEGKLWFATWDSVVECDGKSWRPVLSTGGRPNAILAARDNSIWVASDSGIYRNFHGTWIQNGPEEGLPGEEVTSLCEDQSGRIWAGTSRGISQYRADADPDPPRTQAQAAGESSNVFPEGASVSFSLVGTDKWKFTSGTRLLYSYQVDTNEWSPYKETRTVPLSQLSAGEHYFQARCIDRNWNIDPTPFSFSFTIERPWYKEARLLLVSSAGLVIIALLAGLAFNRHLKLRRSHAEIEAQVALRTKQLELANQELLHSQKMHALGTLAAGIAHDFNSILSIIKGSAQIIEDNLDNPEKIRVRANRINTVVEQGAGIVKAMLGFSRGSGGEIVMCDINAVIGQTVKLLGDRFLREVEVKFEPDALLPKVPASPDFVQQILLNLIFNAAEAMTQGRQIWLKATPAEKLPVAMVLAPAEGRAYILVSVKDTGCGIPPETMPRIFEPFFTTKSLSARRGTGLGLSMVYELAGQMQAGLAVESAVNLGSTFTLILPVRDLPVDEKAAQT